MAARRSDSYDDSGVDPEKFHHLRHDASIDTSRQTTATATNAHPDEHVTALPAGFPTSIPYDSVKPATYSPQPEQPSRRPLTSRIKTEYILLSKKKKIGILVAIVALLALIIGLAAGLSTRSKHSQNLPLPSNHGGPYTGDLTYYAPALGSCGVTSSSSDSIVAVSHLLYDAVSTGSNPNANPLCGKKIRARRDGKSVDLTVVDRCVGCKATDLDVTESVFAKLADIDQGRVTVEWAWLEDVPGGSIPSSSSTASLSSTTTTAASNTTMPAATSTSVTTTLLSTTNSTTSTTPPPTSVTTTTSIPPTTAPTSSATPSTASATGTPATGSPAASTSQPASAASTGTEVPSAGASTTNAPAPTTTA